MKWIEKRFAFGSALTLAGAQATFTAVQLKPGETKKIDLTQAGVPENAELVSLNLTSNGSAPPVVLHSTDVLRDPFRPKFHVFGRVLPNQSGDGPLAVYAVWFVRHDDDTVVRHLVDAARHYEASRFDAVVVPANIAAEAAITPVVAMGLAGYGTAAGLKAFLRDGATYSHQLNILLPIISDLKKTARLPEEVRIALNRLRKLRNEISHSGRCGRQTQPDAAQHLTAAIFGVQYSSFLKSKLDESKGRTQ